MNNFAPEELVLLWKTRLEDARIRYDFARNYVEELRKQCTYKTAHPAERRALLEELQQSPAYQTALQGESVALGYYQYTLKMFTALTIDHKLPDQKDRILPNPETHQAG